MRQTNFKVVLSSFLLSFIAVSLFNACSNKSSSSWDFVTDKQILLDYTGKPAFQEDRNVYCYFDQGAWHGFGLNSFADSTYRVGFTGPFVSGTRNGIWLSPSLISCGISDEEILVRFAAKDIHTKSRPGMLSISAHSKDFMLQQELFYMNDRIAIINVYILNQTDIVKSLKLSFEGTTFNAPIDVASNQQGMMLNNLEGGWKLNLTFPEHTGITSINDTSYKAEFNDPLELKPGSGRNFTAVVSYFQKSEEQDIRNELIKARKNVPAIKETALRYWQSNLQSFDKNLLSQLPENKKELAIKSMQTLCNNWRTAAGDLMYEGMFPSYNYKWFNGFWSWDTWKQAVGTAFFNSELAKNQVRALFAFQDSLGMIPDVIYANSSENNWRDTKPPLSAWSVWKIYELDNDLSFVREMLPKLENYHHWWYKYRDNNQNGFCEYGSCDGSLIAAKWESGMDNAIRFDDIQMLQSAPNAWSMNQESVDLNAYLIAEKKFLANLYEATGNELMANAYREKAEKLSVKFAEMFWDDEYHWFFDRKLNTDSLISVKGPEGWIPMWAGIATTEQANEMLPVIMDSACFNTFVPFPTIEAEHEKFNPENGYWRGPVWLDQFYFGIAGLNNYGFESEAQLLVQKFYNNAEGVYTKAPLRENYHPLTGEGLNAKHFSWTAAHILMLLDEMNKTL